ncbi:MAG: AraC family transcriptional regulator [Pseudomonadota bacterium]
MMTVSDIPPLQINDFGLANYPPGSALGRRKLRDHEILWIERGDCRWEPDGERHHCPPGTVMLCTPGMIDTCVWDPRSITRHGFVHFEFQGPGPDDLPRLRRCPRDDVVRPLLRHAVWLCGQGDDASLGLAAEAVRQALTWYRSGHVASGTGSDGRNPVLSRAMESLARRWGDGPKTPPSIAQWAEDAGVSRGHLARVCQRELGVTPQALLRYVRLDHGLMLLLRSNLKVQEVSELCGFANSFHFSRCCREVYGSSPRTLRARMRAGEPIPLSPLHGLRRVIPDGDASIE